MKVGVRKPSINKSISAKTQGKMTRDLKGAVDPTYGRKGVGMIKNPTRSIKNRVYNRTTFSLGLGSASSIMGVIVMGFIIYGIYTLLKALAPFIMFLGLYLLFNKNVANSTKFIGAICIGFSVFSSEGASAMNGINVGCSIASILGLYFLATSKENPARRNVGIGCLVIWGLLGLFNL